MLLLKYLCMSAGIGWLVSRMMSSYPAHARYHSSKVNSGLCVVERGSSRNAGQI